LRTFPNVQLIDVSKELPGLTRRNGISSWKVMSAKGEILTSFDQASPEELVEPKNDETTKKFLPPGVLKKSMFSPTPEEQKVMQLGRCMRIYPHFNNTGGFFVAVLQKMKAGPAPIVYQRTKKEKNFENKNFPLEQMLVPIPPAVEQGIKQTYRIGSSETDKEKVKKKYKKKQR